MSKRIRIPAAKPGELIARWGRPEPGEPPEIVYAWGGEGASKAEGNLLAMALESNKIYQGRSLMQELKERGYDITTLRFSINRKST